jgi:iron complex transport system substrate-binding protein
MKKWLLLLTILSLTGTAFVLLLAQSDQEPDVPVTVDKPRRIVSLAPSLTEILYELGLGENIAAVSTDSDYPADTSTKKKIGTFWHPNIEAIISCKPDLVITLDFEQQKTVADSLNRLGYNVLTLKTDKIEDLWIAINKIGSTADCKHQTDELVNNLKSKLSELKSKTDPLDKTRVLWVIQSEPLRVAGRNTFINELIELAGGENAVGPTMQQYPPIATEELITCEAQVIIQSAMEPDNIEKQQQAAEVYWSKYPNLPAVEKNRIFVLYSDEVLRLGPRVPEGVEIITRILHPDIFINNTTAK